MSTPSLAMPAAARAAAMSEIAALAEQLELLCREARYAALDGDAGELAGIAERILPLQPRFAQEYRSWLARGGSQIAEQEGTTA